MSKTKCDGCGMKRKVAVLKTVLQRGIMKGAYCPVYKCAQCTDAECIVNVQKKMSED